MFLSWRGSFWRLWLESMKVECLASASLFLHFLPGIESNSANGIPADLRGMMALRRAAPDPPQYRSCCTCTGVLRQREKKVCFPPFIVWLVIQNLIQSWLKSQGAACASEPWIWAFPNHFCTNKIKLVEKIERKEDIFYYYFSSLLVFRPQSYLKPTVVRGSFFAVLFGLDLITVIPLPYYMMTPHPALSWKVFKTSPNLYQNICRVFQIKSSNLWTQQNRFNV